MPGRTRSINELTNAELDTLCDIAYERAMNEQADSTEPSQSDEVVRQILHVEEEPTIEDIRRKYFTAPDETVKNEVFDDPESPRAPEPMPLVPENNFIEKNEDIDIALDPTSGLSSEALPTIADGFLKDNLSTKPVD